VIFKLPPSQCHAEGPDQLRALAFFDLLVGLKLLALSHLPEGGGYPACTGLDFECSFFAMPLFDTENSPAPVCWHILDTNGLAIPGLTLHNLLNRKVTAHGFFQFLDERERTFMPYLCLGDDAHLTCIGSKSGSVISLEQGPRTEWLHLKLP